MSPRLSLPRGNERAAAIPIVTAQLRKAPAGRVEAHRSVPYRLKEPYTEKNTRKNVLMDQDSESTIVLRASWEPSFRNSGFVSSP